MKALRRVLAVMLALVLAVGCFTGCGKQSDKDEQGRTIISIGGCPEKDEKKLQSMAEKKERFETANTDLVVKEDNWNFDRQSFASKAAGGQLPNYFGAGFTEVPLIIGGEYAADVSESLKKYGMYDSYNKQILDVLSRDGKLYMLPTSSYVLGLVFNAEMMEAAGLIEADGTPKQPKDWYELADFAVKIKEATGKPGFVFPTSGNNGGWMFMPIAWSFGVDFMEEDADGNWKATFDTPEAVAALQYIKDLKWKYDVLPSNTLIDGTEMYKTFATGGAAMMLGEAGFGRSTAKYDMPTNIQGIMAMPAGPKKHVTLLGGGGQCVSGNSTEDQIDGVIRWHKLEFDPDLPDTAKRVLDNKMQSNIDSGELIGAIGMSYWSSDTKFRQYEKSLIEKNINTNPNYVKLYNDFVENCPAEIQPEEPVCAQELYAVLDGCIQEVLINKDADCAALLKKAVEDFQADYLDNL